MDPAFLTAVGSAIAVLVQGFRQARKERTDRAERLDEKLDARVMREFDRMEQEIEVLRQEAAALRLRVAILEAHIARHDLPLPPTE